MRLMTIFSLLVGLCSMATNKKQLTLDDIFVSDKFKSKTVSGVQWLPDGKAFVFARHDDKGFLEVWRHDVASGKDAAVLKTQSLTHQGEAVKITAYATTQEVDVLLLTGKRKQIWRHSFSAPYYLYNVRDQSLKPLAKGDSGLQNVALSPDGKTVGFAKESNLYVADVASGKTTQLTHDGSFNILNGLFDWVYEEEFGRADAFRWSPDGTHIAYWFFDQTRVKTMTLLDEIPRYSEPFSLKYPKVGEQNAIVKIAVVDISSGKTTWMDIGQETDIYIPRIEWTNRKGKLAIQRLNRAQNHLELLLADSQTGKTHKILDDRSDTGWIQVSDDFLFLSQSERFLWTSEKDGYRHIYLNDYDGKELAQLTDGDWEVHSIIGVNEETGYVVFNARYDGATERGLFRVKLTGGEVERISAKGGFHTGTFSPGQAHYVGTSSAANRPAQVSLHKGDGTRVRVLEANPIPALDEYAMVYPEFGSFKTEDGTVLNTWMMKPANFDASKKYPVLIFGYGGPGSQMVNNQWPGLHRSVQRVLWHQYLTEQGYIIFCLDNRGTGGRGAAFKHLAYKDLSKWAVHDHIQGAKYLQGLDYVDDDRIGFWGWSGGGYLSLMLMLRGSDVFKTGIAVAPVGDFRNYDTIWTERYMGLLSDNKKGYDAADVLSYVANLKGSLMIIHGTGDDNVHPGNAWQVINGLIAENKQFDMMMYPNRNHRISGGNTSRHLHTLMANYIIENL